jgi:hypothetical protein
MGGTHSGIREMRKAYRIVVRKYKQKTAPSLHRHTGRKDNNIKMVL